MATKSFCPRADLEGSLGVAGQRWGGAHLYDAQIYNDLRVDGDATDGTDSVAWSRMINNALAFYNIANYANLDTAIATIGATEATLIIGEDVAVTTNPTTIPATTTLMFVKGGKLSVATGVTLNIYGDIVASETQQIIDLAGTGTALWYNQGRCTPQWFGAVADYSTNVEAEIQAAINFVAAGVAGQRGGIVFFPAGIYKIIGELVISSQYGVTLEGVGGSNALSDDGSTIKASGVVAGMIELTDADHCIIKNLHLDGNDTGAVCTYGIDLNGGGNKNVIISNVSIDDVGNTGIRDDDGLVCENVRVLNPGVYGFKLESDDVRLVNCFVERSGWAGFYIEGVRNTLIGCLADEAGYRYGSYTGSSTPGYDINSGSSHVLIGCTSKDSEGPGFEIDSNATQSTLSGCSVYVWSKNDTCAALFVKGDSCNIDLVATSGAGAGSKYLLELANSPVYNRISIAASSAAVLLVDGDIGLNDVQLDVSSASAAIATFKCIQNIELLRTGAIRYHDDKGTLVPMWHGAPIAHVNPADYYEFHDDFDGITKIEADGWVLTEDDAADTQAFTDVNFGTLLMTQKATTDDDGAQIIWAQENFQLISGKELWYETRIRCSAGDATNLDFFVGLIEAEDLTGEATNMPVNGIGFHKDDGDTNIDASSSDNDTNLQTAAVDTLVDDTWVRLGLHFDGGASGAAIITPYADGVAGTPISSVTYATMAELAPVFMIRNGDATTTQTLEIDYVKIVQER